MTKVQSNSKITANGGTEMKKKMFALLMIAMAMISSAAIVSAENDMTANEETAQVQSGNKIVRGTITVPDDFEGEMLLRVEEGLDFTDSALIYIDKPGEYSYEIRSYDSDADLSVYFYEEYISNYYSGGRLYYSDGKLTHRYKDATIVNAEGDVTENIDFTILGATIIEGRLLFEEGAFAANTKDITITAENESYTKDWECDITTADPIDYRLCIPETVEGDLTLSFEISDGIWWYDRYIQDNIYSAKYYYTGAEALTMDETQAVPLEIGEDYNQDVIIPAAYSVKGKLIFPENTIGEAEIEEAFVLRYTDENDYEYHYCTVYRDDDDNIEFYLPPMESDYKFRIEPGEISAYSNILGVSCSYVSAEESTNSQGKATKVNITGDTENINFIMKTGNTISGKIILPDGIEIKDGMEVDITVDDADYIGDYDSTFTSDKRTVKITGRETEYMIAPSGNGDQAIKYNPAFGDCYTYDLYYSSDGPVMYPDKGSALNTTFKNEENVDIVIAGNGVEITAFPVRIGSATDNNAFYSDKIALEIGENILIERTCEISDKTMQGEPVTIVLPDIESLEEYKTFRLCSLTGNGIKIYETKNRNLTRDAAAAVEYPLEPTYINIYTISDNAELGEWVEDKALEYTVTEAYASVEDGRITVNVDVEDKTVLENYSPVLYIGVYDSSGRLVDFFSRNYKIEYRNKVSNSITIDTQINPDYTYKLLLWDSIYMRTPLNDAVELEMR